MKTYDQSLAGRRALVTGANSGIGEAVARRLAAAGASVVVNYRSKPEAAQKIVSDINAADGKAIAIQADIADETGVAAMFAQTFEILGGIDILVNNAGIQSHAPFLDMAVSDWDKVMAVNLRGTFLCAQQAARRMATQGGGVIVNISSVHEILPWAGYTHYCASKGGLEMLMKTLALELAPLRIRVNNVAPGAIATPINADWLDDTAKRAKVIATIPWRRIGTAAEVAGAVAFLVSDEADYVTGTTLFIDGGMTVV